MAPVDEPARHRLYDALVPAIGQNEAGTLMQLLPKSDWDEVVTKPYLDARLADLHTEIAGVRSDLHTEIAGVRSETGRLRSELHTEIAGVRVELHEALRTQLVWLIGTMIAMTAVIIAATAALH